MTVFTHQFISLMYGNGTRSNPLAWWNQPSDDEWRWDLATLPSHPFNTHKWLPWTDPHYLHVQWTMPKVSSAPKQTQGIHSLSTLGPCRGDQCLPSGRQRYESLSCGLLQHRDQTSLSPILPPYWHIHFSDSWYPPLVASRCSEACPVLANSFSSLWGSSNWCAMPGGATKSPHHDLYQGDY